MAGLIHLDITLTGAAQNLGTTLDTVAYATQRAKLPGIVAAAYGTLPTGKVGGGYNVRMLTIQADSANAARALVGDSTLSASSWGFFIPKPTASVPEPPLILDGTSVQLNLGEVWLFGQANDILHIVVQPS